MSDEEAYEVEDIVQARVVKTSKKKLEWRYRVKWKGFPSTENTWEPSDSFEGSENILDDFWQNCNTKGRDVDNLSLFRNEEMFYPTSPLEQEKGKNKTKSLLGYTSPPPPREKKQKNQAKRRRSPSITIMQDIDDEPPLKRVRSMHNRVPISRTKAQSAASSRSQTSHRKSAVTPIILSDSSPSPVPPPIKSSPIRSRHESLVPDSEEEHEPSPSPPPKTHSTTNGKKAEPVDSSSSIPITNDDPYDLFGDEPELTPVIPAHRARQTRPLVKTIDPSAPTVKQPTPKKARPGPGRPSTGLRSSLLTFDKNGPKLIRGVYPQIQLNPQALSGPLRYEDNMEVDLPTVAPPTAEELMKLAGLDSKAAEELEDYQDVDTDLPVPSAMSNATKTSLFPVLQSESTLSVNFKDSNTIFGVLCRGKNDSTNDTLELNEPPLNLYITHSGFVPVNVLDVIPQSEPPITWVSDSQGIPGTFFAKEKAQIIIDALRTGGGVSGRLALILDATDNQKMLFETFKEQLQDETLFIFPFKKGTLAICSSKSALVCQRLNIPQKLLVDAEDRLLVSAVSVEDQTAYLNAVC